MKRASSSFLSPLRRISSTPHYQTFPTAPPTSKGRPPSINASDRSEGERSNSFVTQHGSPLPKRQLLVLAVIALAEQTALNSISPYLPDMASKFPDVQEDKIGIAVGAIASAFALAQCITIYFWGWLSDRIGRKPVVMTGTFLTACGFVAFGFSRTLWQAILVQAFIGLVNGNQGVLSTCLGEITDRSNQSEAFTYLPVIYGIGGITGPAVGGLLVNGREWIKGYPYFAPNIFGACLLLAAVFVTGAFLQESLYDEGEVPALGKRIKNLFVWMWQFASGSHRPTYIQISSENTDSDETTITSEQEEEGRRRPSFIRKMSTHLKKHHLLKPDTVLLFLTYLVFQLSNISFNSLYPIFGSASPPTGRGLSPEELGLSMSFAGAFTIVFQVVIFAKLRERLGNKLTYRLSLLLFVFSFMLIPWVGYKDVDAPGDGKGRTKLWCELGVVLVIKTIAAVSGLTSALLLVSLRLFTQP